jgi:hypothetical protein
MQYTSNIPNTTPIHGHINTLLFNVWKSPLINILKQKCLSSTEGVLTEKALLSVSSLAVLYHISLVSARTRDRLEHHQRLASV